MQTITDIVREGLLSLGSTVLFGWKDGPVAAEVIGPTSGARWTKTLYFRYRPSTITPGGWQRTIADRKEDQARMYRCNKHVREFLEDFSSKHRQASGPQPVFLDDIRAMLLSMPSVVVHNVEPIQDGYILAEIVGPSEGFLWRKVLYYRRILSNSGRANLALPFEAEDQVHLYECNKQVRAFFKIQSKNIPRSYGRYAA